MENTSILAPSIARAANLLTRAYSHKIRITMMQLLEKNGRLCVSDFYEKRECVKAIGERLEQSMVSQHLAILRRANLVKAERDGKRIHYELTDRHEAVQAALRSLADMMPKAAAA